MSQAESGTIAAKPQLVQIITAYGGQKEGSPVLPRNKYTAIRDDQPKSKDEAKHPELKVCKFATDAIITEGSEIGTIHRVCANPACPVHHPKKQTSTGADNAQWKAEQEKRRREEAIANAAGLRVLSGISAAVPVRLMKRDLLFMAERLANLLDENRVAILARQYGIKKAKENESIGKLFTTFLRRADEGTLGRAVVEAVILLTASRGNAAHVLREAAEVYKVAVAAITAKVKQEFAAKERAKTEKNAPSKQSTKTSGKPIKKAAHNHLEQNPLRGVSDQAPLLSAALLPPLSVLPPSGRPSLTHPTGSPRRHAARLVPMLKDRFDYVRSIARTLLLS